MAFEDLRARTASHLRSRLPAALQMPVICFSHVERTDSIGVTGRIFKELADLGIADVPLLDPSDATHVAGRVVSPEPVGFRRAVADALGDFTVVLQEAASDGRLVLCGGFAKDVFSRVPGLQDIVAEESVSCVPHPELWFRHVDAVHQALDEALKDASDGEAAQFPDADTFTAFSTRELATQNSVPDFNDSSDAFSHRPTTALIQTKLVTLETSCELKQTEQACRC